MTDAPCTAALDTSSAHASFVVQRDADGELLIADHDTAVGRRSAALLERLLELLAEAGLALSDIRRWTIGMGPGSFTGIRVGAALVKGICTAGGAHYRGLPSTLALAAQTASTSVTILHDGRRDEVIASPCKRLAESWQQTAPSAAVAIDQLAAAGCYAMLATDRAADEVAAALGKQLLLLPRLEATGLLDPPTYDWPETWADAAASTEPVYVRPAVFVEPQRLLPPAAVTRLLNSGSTPQKDATP